MTEANTPPESQNQQSDPLDRVVRIGMLVDLYGGLLTERQRKYVQLHFEEDLSFGEIARTHGVSRQAIHDAVKHALKALEGYETKLQLLERGIAAEGGMPVAPEAVDAPVSEFAPAGPAEIESSRPLSADASGAVRSAAADIREIVETMRRSGGILYNANELADKLQRTAEALDEAAKN